MSANYKMVHLNPYKGWIIDRLTVDGRRSYAAYHRGEKIYGNSLVELKKKIKEVVG